MTSSKIADRIRKLLALAESSNEHEAAAAAARAADLMVEHQVHAAMLAEDESDSIDQFCIEETGRAVSWRGILAAGVAQSFGCGMYWSHCYVNRTQRCRVMIVGRRGDVDAVSYTFRYLCNELDRLAAQAWRDRPAWPTAPSARTWKNAFRVGAARTVAGRLRRHRDEWLSNAGDSANDVTKQALLRVARDHLEVEAFMNRLGVRSRPGPVITSVGGLGAGMSAGRSVDIGRDRAQLGRPVALLTGARPLDR